MRHEEDGAAAVARGRGGESGRGFIGFLIAIVVVVFVGYTLKSIYVVKARYDDFNVYCKELLPESVRKHSDPEDVRFAILKKAKELDVPLDNKALEVTADSTGWRIRYEYDDPVKLPGYTYVFHGVIDHTFKKF